MTESRSWEFSAVPVVLVMLGGLALLMWAASSGAWVWFAVGVVGLVVVLVLALRLMTRPSHPAAESAPVRHALGDGIHRVLVVADDACSVGDLQPALAGRGNVEAYVLAPALGSRTARWTGDEHAYRDAAAHLEATLAALAELHVKADGHVGPHDPLQAADDGLREFPADEIVFAVHAGNRMNWLENGVVAAARTRYDVPIMEIVLGAV